MNIVAILVAVFASACRFPSVTCLINRQWYLALLLALSPLLILLFRRC